MIDHVFPLVPVRQWVLSVPFALRYRMAYDSNLMNAVLNVFVRAVLGSLRRRARNLLGLGASQGGAVTFVQRFGDALNLNVHFHTLVLDGVYTLGGANERREFHLLPAPEDEEIVELTTIVAARIQSLLDRRSIGTGNSEQEDMLPRWPPKSGHVWPPQNRPYESRIKADQ